jgi:RNA polymerase sigma-70 factor (ECF subfamily)
MALLWHERLKQKKMTTINNMYLIDACKEGDKIAQLQIYKLYYDKMFNISIRLVQNAITADEIVRESFIGIFDKLHYFKAQADLISLIRKQVEERSAEAWKRNNVSFPGLVTDRLLVNNRF